MPLSADQARELHARELDRIERILSFVCRRNGLSVDEAEEFRAETHLRLLEEDLKIVRAFDGRSRFSTFLTTVILRLLQDFRVQRWGKWRPSAAARRGGEIGVRLETMVVRDRLSFDEAVRALAANYGVTTPRDELQRLLHSFPLRHGRASRTAVPLDSAPEIASDSSPDQSILGRELGELETKFAEALRAGLRSLSDTDRLILKMVYLDDLRIATVADSLRLDRRRMYRRLAKLHRALRRALDEQGVSRQEFRRLVASRPNLSRLELSEVFEPHPSNPVSAAGQTAERMGR